MALANVLTSYYRPKPGGYCKRYYQAINALLGRGAVVHYLAVEKYPIEHDQCIFHQFPWPKNRTENLMFWLCFHLLAPFILLYLGYRYKITHAFAFGTTYAFVLQPLRILKRIPLSLFLRGDAIAGHRIKGKPWWVIKLDQLFEGLAIQGVGLYGVSDTLSQAVVKRHVLFKPAHHGTLRNNLDSFVTGFKAECDEPLTIGSVGILEKTKNQQLLIQCLAGLPREKIKLVFFGIGPDKNELLELGKALGVSEQVEFKGWVVSETIWPEIDMLAMPSLYEGAPNAVLEALSNRVPVLASDISAHREILPPESLVPAQNVSAWQEKIMTFIANPSLRGDLQKRQERFSDKLIFNWGNKISSLILEGC